MTAVTGLNGAGTSIAPGLEWLTGDRLPASVNLLGHSGPTGQLAASGLFPDGPNIYNYARQAPGKNTDPTGLETPRYYPLNLREALAMEEAMSGAGQCIMTNLNFPKGGTKYQRNHGNIAIHHIRICGICGDDKFK